MTVSKGEVLGKVTESCISALQKHLGSSCVTTYCHVRRASPDIEPASTLMLYSLAFETMRNKILLFISYPSLVFSLTYKCTKTRPWLWSYMKNQASYVAAMLLRGAAQDMLSHKALGVTLIWASEVTWEPLHSEENKLTF